MEHEHYEGVDPPAVAWLSPGLRVLVNGLTPQRFAGGGAEGGAIVATLTSSAHYAMLEDLRRYRV
jgi:hypothetical protein